MPSIMYILGKYRGEAFVNIPSGRGRSIAVWLGMRSHRSLIRKVLPEAHK